MEKNSIIFNQSILALLKEIQFNLQQIKNTDHKNYQKGSYRNWWLGQIVKETLKTLQGSETPNVSQIFEAQSAGVV